MDETFEEVQEGLLEVGDAQEVWEELLEVGDALKEIRVTAMLLATYSRLKKAKNQLIKLRLELEAAMEENQPFVGQSKNPEALRLMCIKAGKLNAQQHKVRAQVLRLQAQLIGFVGEEST